VHSWPGVQAAEEDQPRSASCAAVTPAAGKFAVACCTCIYAHAMITFLCNISVLSTVQSRNLNL
jgi:hypothetical protein